MNNEFFSFELLKVDPETGARAGILHTPHGDIDHPYICLLARRQP